MSETKTPETAVPEQSAPQGGAELTVQDLMSLKQIIDVASQRGAFQPKEMVVVGTAYSKLDAFLAAVQAQQSAQQETAKGE